MIVIAHRGACHEAIENTWRAFELTKNMGAHRVELDVRLLKDGEMVVCHDDSLERVFSRKSQISQMTREDLKKIRQDHPDHHIPRLKEVLDSFIPSLGFHVEIKENNLHLAEAVVHLVQLYSESSCVVLGSFYPNVLKHIRKIDPDRPLAFIWDHTTFQGTPQKAHELLGGASLLDYHPHVDCLNKDMIEEAHSLGGRVYPWISYEGVTLEDEQKIWPQLLALGVDGLCTNFPRQLLHWLGQKRSY